MFTCLLKIVSIKNPVTATNCFTLPACVQNQLKYHIAPKTAAEKYTSSKALGQKEK